MISMTCSPHQRLQTSPSSSAICHTWLSWPSIRYRKFIIRFMTQFNHSALRGRYEYSALLLQKEARDKSPKYEKVKSLNSKTDISIFINLRYLRLKLLKNKENNKKICHIFHHNFKNIPCYIMSEVSKVSFCSIWWLTYFKNFEIGVYRILNSNSSSNVFRLDLACSTSTPVSSWKILK